MEEVSARRHRVINCRDMLTRVISGKHRTPYMVVKEDNCGEIEDAERSVPCSPVLKLSLTGVQRTSSRLSSSLLLQPPLSPL